MQILDKWRNRSNISSIFASETELMLHTPIASLAWGSFGLSESILPQHVRGGERNRERGSLSDRDRNCHVLVCEWICVYVCMSVCVCVCLCVCVCVFRFLHVFVFIIIIPFVGGSLNKHMSRTAVGQDGYCAFVDRWIKYVWKAWHNTHSNHILSLHYYLAAGWPSTAW